MMRQFAKKILGPAIKRIHASWLKKPRKYSYKDMTVVVAPGVFPPFLTLSPKLLLEFLEPLPLKGKTFLELGCGCGIISIAAARKGAAVTSTDINQTALDMLAQNAKDNAVALEILYSDLFEKLSGRRFDYIVINPPYYPKTPRSIAEQAWFCGENFDYFQKLFCQLTKVVGPENKVFMILSEDCEIEKIKAIAHENAINFELAAERKAGGERNFIFALASLSIRAAEARF